MRNVLGTNSRIIRFSVVGLFVATTYVLSYAILSWMGIQQVFSNAFAFFVAIIIQYLLQTSWTFQRSLTAPGQPIRFITMVVVGYLYSAIFTAIGSRTGMFPAWLAAGFVAATLPVLNYLLMRYWVYGDTQQGERK